MSEIVLSNNNYDYSNGSMMINPGLVQKSTSSSTSGSPPTSNFTTDNQQYSTYPGNIHI